MDARCLACDDTACAFRPLVIQRRAVGPKDILIQIKFCGVCASDLWTARSGQSVRERRRGADHAAPLFDAAMLVPGLARVFLARVLCVFNAC